MSRLTEEREFARQLVRRHETDRRRLSFTLHDCLTHPLAQLVSNFDLIARESPLMNARASQLFDDSRELSRACFRRLLEITGELSTTLVAAVGLPAALECRVAAFKDHTGVRVRVEIADCPPLPTALELALCRVVDDFLDALQTQTPSTVPVVSLARVGDRIELAIGPVHTDVAAAVHARLRLEFGRDVRVAGTSEMLTISTRVPPAR